MTRVRGLSNATKRLRGFGLAVIAMMASAGLALVGFSGAQSAADGSDSKIDYAASLTSMSMYSSDASLRAESQLTFEAWIKPTGMTHATNDHVLAKRHYDFAVVVQGGKWAYYFGDGSDWSSAQDTGVSISRGSWQHVALVLDGNSTTFFVNGHQVHQTSGRANPPQSDTSEFVLGSWGTSAGIFEGHIDEVKLWSTNRSSSILNDMHTRSPAGSGLVGYWSFNHGSSSTIYGQHSTPNLTASTLPAYEDVKQVSAASDGDTVITFPRTYLPGVGGWTVPENASDFRALVVAGGGSGTRGIYGVYYGQGGGGGGAIIATPTLSLGSTLSITVGQGGIGTRQADNTVGVPGQPSSFGTSTANGGQSGNNTTSGNQGAYGGISGNNFGGGFGGADGDYDCNDDGCSSGGGGGAGGVGSGRDGGLGLLSDITGTSLYYGSGGAGRSSTAYGSFSQGGAGIVGVAFIDAMPNRGGGGSDASGLASSGFSGGGSPGGSGVVIVRYTPTRDNSWNTPVTTAGAYAFRNSTSDPVLPVSPSAAWTWEAWIYPTNLTPEWTPLFAQQAEADTPNWKRNAIWFRYAEVVLISPSASIRTGVNLPTNRWVHVAWAQSTGTAAVLYIDGVAAWSSNLTSRTGDSGTFFTVAGAWQAEWGEFPGQMDQVKVWGSQLSSTQVASSMHAFSTFTDSPGLNCSTGLRAHFDFNEFSDGQVLDRSGCGRHLEFNTAAAGNYANSDFTDSAIIETGTAHSEQSYVKFLRSYLTSTGGWTPPAGVTNYKALVVAGGGGGGSAEGGGGGAGEFFTSESMVSTQSELIPVQVGQGGLGGIVIGTTYPRGANGQSTSVLGLALSGGGGGASLNQSGALGGSGGGGSNGVAAGAANASSGKGFAGGSGSTGTSGKGGGGGGARSSGESASSADASDGAGGGAVASDILGPEACFAGGGGGGRYHSNANAANAQGGRCLDGTEVGGDGARGLMDGYDAVANSGSGGGGGGSRNSTGYRDGGSGGAGVVILSWGPYLEVTQSPTVARAGEAFRDAIKLQVMDESTGQPFLTSYPVTATASANVLTLNGVLLTQSYTVQSSAVDGTVDFSGLGFASNVSGPVTLTFTSDQFVGTSLVVTPNYFPENVEIVASGTTGGTFLEGEFFANSGTGTTSINKDDLVAHLASYSTVISASGYVSVKTSFTSQTTSDLVLKAGGYVNVDPSVIVRTHGGDIVLWADSDDANGGFIRLLGSATLCTTAGDCATSVTGGGDIVLGGGLPSVDNPLRPSGPAKGSGNDGAGTDATSTGVQLGTMESGNTGSKLYSAGGDIRILGRKALSTSVWSAGIAFVGGTDIRSGNGTIYIFGESTEDGSSTDGTMEFNAWGGGAGGSNYIESRNTSSNAIVIEGKETGTATSNGMWGSNDNTTIASSGSLTIRADHLNTSLDLNLDVAGELLIEPYGTELREAQSGTVFNFQIGTGDDFNLLRNPAGIRIGSASNSNRVNLPSSFNSNGPIEILANQIQVGSNVDLITTAQGARVLLKSRDWIDYYPGTNSTTYGEVTTNNGDIIFWSDSDGNGTGSIYFGVNNQLNSANGAKSETGSGGGRITFGGGADGEDAQGHPLGFAGDTGLFNGGTNYWSILLQETQIYSGGGDVTFRAKSDYGSLETMRINDGAQVWSGTGVIRADVRKVGAGNTFRMYQNSWVSAATTSPAIDINAQSTGTGGVFEAMSSGTSLVALGSGGISVTTTTSNTTVNAITMVGMDLLSKEGDIEMATNGRFSWATNAARAIGSKSTGDITTSSANVRITAQGFIDSTGNSLSKISTSGKVEILPASGSFGVDSHLNFEVEAETFEFGGTADVNSATKNIILYKDVTTSGAITISAATITVVNGVDLVTTGDQSRITLKAKDWIDIRSGSSATSHSRLQTNNGDIILWADADGNGTGGIYLGTHNELNSANGVKSKTQSGGGRITIAGSYGYLGVDGDGHPLGALGGTIQQDGVAQNRSFMMMTGAEIFSGGGDVTIRAISTITGEAAAYFDGTALIWSGTGAINASASHEASGYGLALENGSWVSAATTSPAIEVNTSTAGAGNYFAFYSNNSTTPFTFASLANSGGGISVSARTAASTYQAIRLYGADLLSGAGAISITTNAYTVWNTTVQRNLGAKSGSDVTSSSADVQIVANGVYDNTGNSASRISTSGAVSFKPSGSTYAIDYSIQFEIEAGSFDFGKIENVNSATNDVTFLSDVTTQGGITVSAQSIVISAGDDLISTGNQQSIFLKAESDISAVNGSATTDAGHSRVQTNNGDIVFWADSDGDGTGGIRFGNYSQINSANGSTSSAAISGGGDLIFAGGTSTDSRGYPTGFAGTGAGSTDRSVQLAELTGLYTGGGDLYMRGKAAGFGVVMWRGLEIFSGTGRIDIEGESSATNTDYAGVAFVDTNYGGTGGPLTIVSAATSSPAVRLSGRATTGVASLRLWGVGSANVIQIASTAESGGGIELSGRSAASSAVDIYLTRAQILSRNGSVTISSGVNKFHLGTGNNVFGSSPSSDYVTTSSASLTFASDEWDFDSSGHQFNTSGDVSVLPYTNNYFGANTTFAFATDKIRNLTIGKPPTVGDSSPTITITGTHSVSGAIRIYGGTLNLAGTSNYLRAAGTISMVANGDIDVQENITTFGGPIVLWSNADGTTTSTGGGRIDLDAAATLTSNGGDVVFGGGTSANYLGYPAGNAKSQDASALASIDLYGDIDSSGGDVIMRAEGPSGAGSASLGAITMRVGSQISSGAGDISISGRVPSDTTNSGNQWGQWFGTNTTTNQPTITSTTGDISLLGDATAYISNARNNRPGIVLYSGLIQSDTGDISIEGRAAEHSTGAFVDITGWDAGGFTISSSGNVTLAGRAGGTINLQRVTVTNAETLSILTDFLTSGAASNVRANRLVIDHALASPAGTSVLETPTNLTIQPSTGDLVMGSSGVGQVLVSKAVSISGNVQVQATNVSLSANVFAGGNSPSITISADVFDVSASVKATGGNLALLANTAGRGIMLGGTTTSALLQVSDSELDQLFATNLRIGDSSTADIFIAGDISISSSRVTNLLLRSAGDVIASPGAEITAQNIAVEAGGIIDLIGDNAVSGNVALSASSGVSYSSAVSYSPAAVAEFVPVFGIGVAVSQTNSPTVAQANEFLAVTFNPPPQFVVTDSYSNTLDLNNRLAASFTVSASVTQGTGTVTGLTASFSAGVYSFNSLRVDSNPGTYSFTVNVDDGASGFSTSSAEYNVQSGDPQQLIVTATDSTAPSGQASFSYSVSVQDQGGNPIVAGTNANLTVSASVSGAVLVSGGQVQADNAGTATFTDLVITGSVSSQISISFFVEFTNNNSVFTTVSSAVSAVTLTPGTATQLRIDDASQSVANRSTLSDLVIDLLDAQGNIVYDRTDDISVSIGSGSGATLVGTNVLSFTAGGSSLAQLTFNNLSLQGTVGSYRLDFESDQAGIASVSHDVTLTHGLATSLTISQIASTAQSGINISSQPEITIVDADNNTVLTGSTASASISAVVSGAGYAIARTGVDLSGVTSLSATSGVAAFGDLRLTGKAGSYTLNFEIPGTDFSVSQVVEVTAGTASKFKFIQLPQDVEAGQTFAQTVSAEILDATDNRVLTAGTGTVVQAVWDINGVGGSFGVTYGFVPSQGLIEFNGLTWSIANTYSLRIEVASGSVLTGIAATSSPLFVVTPAGPSKIEWVGSEPTGGVSNGLLDVQPSFVIKDQFDNEVEVAPLVTVSASVVSANSGDVVRVIGGAATNSGNQFVNFSGLGLEALVDDYVLSFSAEVAAGVFASVSTSQPVTITHGSLSALVLVTPAGGAGSDLAFDDQPVLELRDTAGNRVSTSAQAGLTVRASQPGLDKANDGADLGGTIDVAAEAGEVRFANLKLTGKVTSYSLSYTVIGTAFSTSQSITLAAGDPDSFRFLQQPTDFVAGNGFSPAVSAEVIDSEGNRVLSASNSVNVFWAMNGVGSYGLTSGFIPASGVLDLSTLNFTKAASYKLRLEATGLTSVNSDTFVIGHDVAAGLEWIVDPTGGWQSGKDITTLPKLRVVDQYNNAVSTGPVVTVSASVVGANSAGVLAVTGNEASGVGEIEFANLNITAIADSYVLSFSGEVNGVTFGSITTSGTIDITHGDPTQLTIITPAAGSRAGLALAQSPVLEIQDSAGNRVEDAALTVTVTSSAQVLIGTQQINASSGTASFAVDLGLEGSSSNGITLTYKTTFNGQDLTTSQSIDLLAGLPSSLRILEDSSTVSTRAVFSPVPSVEVLDAYGNVVLSDNDSEVTVALYRNGVAISSESDAVTASSGVVAFSGLSYVATPNSNYKLQFSHTSISAVVTSSPFVIEPGPVAKAVIDQQPRTITGGVTTTKTGELFEDNAIVKLYDIDDNLVDTIDSGVITATITSGTGGTLISASASITNGSATFGEMRLVGVVETPEQSAQDYKLTFSYGGFSSSESDVLKVKHNVATQMTMVTNASGGKASAIFTTKPKVRLLDRYGNWVSGTPAVSIQPVVFDESGLTSPSVFNAQGGEQTVNGEAEFSIGISGTTATTYRLEFIATTDQGVPITSASQSGITIGHGAASRLHILRNPASDDGSGNLTKIGSALNVQPVIEIQDSDHNRVLDFTGVIDAQIATKYRGDRDYLLNHTVSAVAGVATFSNLAIVGSVTESYALSFYRLGLPSPSVTSTTFTLTHGDAEYLTIETQPAGGNKTGSALSQSPTIAVRDFDGNITTTLNGASVSAAVFSGGGAIDTTGSNTDKASVVNGVAQFSNLTVVALPGVDQSLVFTLDGAANSASGLVTSSASVTFSLIVSDAYQLSVFTEPCTAADCTAGPTAELLGVQPVVEVQDRFGNRVEGFSGLVTATLQGTGGSLRDADGQISSRSVAVVNGLATFTDLRIEGVPGNNYSLQFATSGLQSTTSQDVQVIHTTPSQLVITQQPVGGVTGDELASQPVVEVRDRFGNLAATDNATTVSVSVFSGATRLSGLVAEVTGSLTVTAVNGVATFSGLELFARTGENYVLKFAASGFDVLSNGVVVSPAGANSLEWVTEPVAQRTGEVMNVQPVLRMLDFDGNIAASTSATVVASVTNGGGYIEAGTTSSAVEGIITFAGLTLVALPNVDQTLTFTATTASGSFSITTVTSLNVQHTAASTMSIDVGYATSNEQGAVLGTQPVIKLYDRFGNLTVNDNSTVVTATIGSGAGGAISGSATATAVRGVVTFAGLAVTGSPGVDYTLDFSAGAYGVSGSAQLRLFKTAALEVSYSNIVYSSSPTTSPAIAFTDSTEHSISFSVSTPQFCTINATSGEVSIVGAGTCVIQASVADGTYYKATSKDVNLTIEKAQQDPVVITNNAFVNFGEVLTLTSSGGSSTATTRFFATGECQILGNSLITFGSATEGSAATCTILASRNGDANYLASTAAPMDIEIRRVAQQPISIGNARNISVGDVELFLIGGSGTGAVSYAVQIGTNTAGCVVTDGVLSATKNGSCEVVATKAQSTNYNLATSAVATFTFTKQTQTVTITSAAPSMPLPGQSFQIVATASGATTISYAVTKGQAIAETQFVSASPAVCQLSQSVSGQVTFLRSGECEVTATAASSDKFASATGKMNILVGQLNQFITFDALSDKTFGDPAFRLVAEASSGLPVSFSVSAGVSVCSISNGMVTINAAGVCEITASQAGNGSYAPAPNVVRSFVVNPGVASSPALISAAVGNQWFTLRFTEPSYNGGSPIVAYRLEVRDQNDNLYVSTTTNTQSPLSVTAVGIPNNTPYTAKVTAITAAGLGQFSNTTVPLTPSDAAMSVTQLSADTSTSGLEMSWVTPEAIEGNFLRYEVYAWVTGTEEPQTPTVTLTDSTSDAVTVAISSISNAVSASPASYVAPRLEIVQPLFRTTGGVHIFGAVKTKPIGFFALASISQPNTASATVGYTMRVVTITDVKSSSQVINTANGVKVGLSAPSAPTQFNIDSSDPDKLVITWAAPNSDGGFPLIDYQMTSNGQVICANIQTRLCEVSPLALSTTYNIEVKARNALGLGDAAAGSHTTPDPAPVVNTQALNEQTLQLVSNLPKLSIFQPRIVRPGELVTVTGEKLDILRTLSLGSVAVDFSVIGTNSLTFRVPVATEPGTYNIIHTSAFGTVTVMDALTVAGAAVEEEIDPVEPPETDVPLIPEGSSPERPITPENGTQAPNTDLGNSGSSEPTPGQPTEPLTPEVPAPTETQEPKPAPEESQSPNQPAELEEENLAAGPVDSKPVFEFSLSLAMILAVLMILFVLRMRNERSRS